MRKVVVGLAITFGSLAPSWVQADDQQIAQDIVQKLKDHQSRGDLRGFKIDLQVDQGTVLLTGQVADVEQQQLALDLARNVEGVTQVVNDLDVKGTEAAEPTRVAEQDSEASQDMAHGSAPKRFALSGLTRLKLLGSRESQDSADVAVPSRDLSASGRTPRTARENVRQTSATELAGGEAEFDRASPIAAVEPSDEQLAQTILGKLQQHKASGKLQGFHLDLKVEEGSVWMDGRVSTAEQKRLALDVARRVPGVVQVVDAIRVESGPRARMASTPARRSGVTPASAAQHGADVPGTFQADGAAPLEAAPQAVYGAAPPVAYGSMPQAVPMVPHYATGSTGIAPVRYDHPHLPSYAWPSYAAYPNYAAVTYPRQYSATAWPYIGPFYPYPQVPLGWRKVMLEWDDGWWHLDFKEK